MHVDKLRAQPTQKEHVAIGGGLWRRTRPPCTSSQEVVYVSSHEWDVAGAAAVGMPPGLQWRQTSARTTSMAHPALLGGFERPCALRSARPGKIRALVRRQRALPNPPSTFSRVQPLGMKTVFLNRHVLSHAAGGKAGGKSGKKSGGEDCKRAAASDYEVADFEELAALLGRAPSTPTEKRRRLRAFFAKLRSEGRR